MNTSDLSLFTNYYLIFRTTATPASNEVESIVKALNIFLSKKGSVKMKMPNFKIGYEPNRSRYIFFGPKCAHQIDLSTDTIPDLRAEKIFHAAKIAGIL